MGQRGFQAGDKRFDGQKEVRQWWQRKIKEVLERGIEKEGEREKERERGGEKRQVELVKAQFYILCLQAIIGLSWTNGRPSWPGRPGQSKSAGPFYRLIHYTREGLRYIELPPPLPSSSPPPLLPQLSSHRLKYTSISLTLKAHVRTLSKNALYFISGYKYLHNKQCTLYIYFVSLVIIKCFNIYWSSCMVEKTCV